MTYGPKTQAFYEKYKLTEADNPLANIDESLSYAEVAEMFDIAEFRENTREFFKDFSTAELPEDIVEERIEHPKAKLLVFKPRALKEPAPVIIYNIAGGFTLDMSEEQRLICCKMAKQANAIVISLTPGLAPEMKLPEIFVDAYEVMKFLYTHAASYQGDPKAFFLTGYSCGAKLAFMTALKAVQDKDFTIAGLALISGDYDLSQACNTDPDALAARRNDFMAKPGMMKFFLSQYLPSFTQDLQDPFLSPYYTDLHGLPPTTLIVGSNDIFLGDNKAIASKLADSGVLTKLIVNEGHIHNTTLLYDTDLGDGEDPSLQAASAIKDMLAGR